MGKNKSKSLMSCNLIVRIFCWDFSEESKATKNKEEGRRLLHSSNSHRERGDEDNDARAHTQRRGV